MIRELPPEPSFQPVTATVADCLSEYGPPNVRAQHDGHRALTWHRDDHPILLMDFCSHRMVAMVPLPEMAMIAEAYDAAMWEVRG